MKAKLVEDRNLPYIVTNERDEFGVEYRTERVMSLNEARALFLELGEVIECAEQAQKSQPQDVVETRKDFAVVWEYDSLAHSPQEAAEHAWAALRKPDSTANVFDVYDEEGNHTRVDLQQVMEKRASNPG